MFPSWKLLAQAQDCRRAGRRHSTEEKEGGFHGEGRRPAKPLSGGGRLDGCACPRVRREHSLIALVGTCPLTATAHPPMLTNTSLPANRHRPLLGHMLNGVGPMGSQARLQGILSPYSWREKDGNQCPQLCVTPLSPQQ